MRPCSKIEEEQEGVSVDMEQPEESFPKDAAVSGIPHLTVHGKLILQALKALLCLLLAAFCVIILFWKTSKGI